MIASSSTANCVVARTNPLTGGLSGSTPVSYTHLDVYKRQHQERLRRVLDGVEALRWFHGHHHVRYSSTIPAAHGEVQVEGLALDGEPLKAVSYTHLDVYKRQRRACR